MSGGRAALVWVSRFLRMGMRRVPLGTLAPPAQLVRGPVDEGIPRRCNVGTPWAAAHGGDVVVLLDGEPQRLVRAWDVRAGTVDRFVPGPDGRAFLNEAKTEAVREVASGRVEVRWKPGRGGGA